MNTYSYININKNQEVIMRCTYKLDGLECPSCAMKIEEKIKQVEGFEDVQLNFTTQTLSFEGREDDYKQMLQKEVDQIEDGVTVTKREINQVSLQRKGTLAEVKKKERNWLELRLGIGSVFLVLPFILDPIIGVRISLFLLGYLFIGGDVLYRAGKNILRGHIFDENFLMSVATIGAMIVGDYPEGVAVMLFYQVGELFQNRAVGKSRQSIGALMDIRPDVVWVKKENKFIKVEAESIQVGEFIKVKPGERIPLDGKVMKGRSFLDTSALTGESIPRSIKIGDQVLSGSVNQTGVLEIKVEKRLEDSTVSRILEMVENATNRKAKTEAFITKFAKYYTPVVVYLALALAILPPLFLVNITWQESIHRALIFLVISCPCALVISIPLGFFGGIGGASSQGILVKGSNYLEALNQIDTVVFDKTGTLTKGNFKVIDSKGIGIKRQALLALAATLESYSTHPIGQSIIKAYGHSIEDNQVMHMEEVWGKGLVGEIAGEKVMVGNAGLMADYAIEYEEINHPGTVVHVAKETSYLGYILIADEIKEDSKEALEKLRKQGIKHMVMLTGDREAVGEEVGRMLGMDQVYTELLPHEKVSILENILEERGEEKVIFVGDGLNDAPVLARASIGVAMGGIGSDAAIEAADIVLMTDEPSKLADAFKVARKTRKIVWQNIIFALSVKGLVLLLGALGVASMWAAVFADVGVALIAIMNAMRIIRNPLK